MLCAYCVLSASVGCACYILSRCTGILEPKPIKDRFFVPPFSLLFNVAVNPSLTSAKGVMMALLTCSNPFVGFRLVVSMQPIVQHAEMWLAVHMRPMFRRYATFARKRAGDADASELPNQSYILAAKALEKVCKL